MVPVGVGPGGGTVLLVKAGSLVVLGGLRALVVSPALPPLLLVLRVVLELMM